MSLITLPFTFSVGAVIIAAQHNSNFQTIYNDYNGNIQGVNIAANAAIGYSKLSLNNSIQNTDILSTTVIIQPGQISGAAITLLPSLPSGAGLIPVANVGALVGSPITGGSANSSILASTDGFVNAYCSFSGGTTRLQLFTDSSSTPSTKVDDRQAADTSAIVGVSGLIKKGNHYQVTQTNGTTFVMTFTPLGS